VPGDFGLVVENGMAWLVRALPVDDGRAAASGCARRRGPTRIHLQRLMPADALRVRGRHNAANALAALALATAIGCPLAPMLHGLREYAGEPHRVEYIATVGGVEAFDDSKGTNVGATVAALEGLGADKRAGQAGGDPGRRRQGQDFSAAGRPGGPPCARAVATDRPRRRRHRRRALPMPRRRAEQPRHAGGAVAWCFEQAKAAMPCCSARPAPAWTCSATTPTAPRCSPTRCARIAADARGGRCMTLPLPAALGST
jgi:UDP-N-acetylmuramoylalanine--D-glutamate ligase